MQSTDESMINELEIQKSIAASDMYSLLSMLLHLPTEEIAAGILDGSLAEDVLAIFEELGFSDNRIETIKTKLGALQRISGKDELLTEMRREYTRLFAHPKKPAIDIYETLFLFQPQEGQKDKPTLFISPAAMDAQRCYKQAGLVKSKEANEPEDHMATEMEFMAYLYMQKAKALNEDNQEGLAQRNEQIKEFSELHLRKWGIDFFDSCISSSERDVYRTFGQIGSTFMSKMLEN